MHDWARIVRERLLHLTGRAPEEEFVEELSQHLAQIYEEARASGVPEHDALARAMRPMVEEPLLLQASQARRPGVARRVADWSRQEPPGGGGGFMAGLDFRRDSRYALRMLIRTPVFSLIAILTFAVGIGVNAALFSVVNGVLLRPLPYPDADRIVMVWLDNRREGIREDITSYPNYRDWRDQSTSFEFLAAFTRPSFSLTGAGEPERIRGAGVTANFFDVMGVRPLLGRVFTAANEVEGQDAVVVLSHGLWQRRLGGAADALGRTVSLNGRPHEIIGVMPREMRWPDASEFWKPLAPNNNLREARASFWLPVIGKLKPGVGFRQAQTEMDGIGARLEQAFPTNRGFGAYVVPFHQQLVGKIERPLAVLTAAVAFVLLIACANLANLMLGRTAARRKELAIRTALGAGRGRLVRQVVTEALVLAFIGGAVGLGLAYWAIGVFVSLGGPSIPRADTIRVDAAVLGYSGVLAMLSALVSGLVPAIHMSRASVAGDLRETSRLRGGVANRRTRHALVAVEVALALVLLTGAGLLIRTLWSMQHLDRGFRADRVALATLSLPPSTYPDGAPVRGFYLRLLDRVRSLPGVESAALSTGVLQPVLTNSSIFSIEGKPLPPPEERVEYPYEFVSPGFFETLGISLASGRTFSDQDHADAPHVAIINETLARRGWPDRDPIGQRIRPGSDRSQAPWVTVVGVINDVHRSDAFREIRPEIYMPAQQTMARELQTMPRTMTLVVRTAGEPGAVIPSLRRELQALDPQLPLFNAGTLEGELSKTLVQPRFQATLLGGFAAIALLLAAVGVYGVTSHAVSQRIQEVGIRMALGARRRDVLSLILRQHLGPALIGVAVGVAAALLLSRSLRSLLYGVRATDPLTFSIMAVVLIVVAAAACWIPARRAARIDPLVALRAE